MMLVSARSPGYQRVDCLGGDAGASRKKLTATNCWARRSEVGLASALTGIYGFRLRDRWAGWDRTRFTSDSRSQVAVFEKLP